MSDIIPKNTTTRTIINVLDSDRLGMSVLISMISDLHLMSIHPIVLQSPLVWVAVEARRPCELNTTKFSPFKRWKWRDTPVSIT